MRRFFSNADPDVRLRQIKIAGFKSFADLTVIDIDVPLTGIVGPNGCGKSNIIDAVRWVLGEGRASGLRGKSRMTELIFAGSTGRAELGRASVELLLENDGTLEGPWGRFAEIAVKRVITREGDVTYTINRQAVRRRDVQELFAGTGLGTKSYAIISQGTVEQFIQARPEELRNYFEEAAGVGLYRERRRETETLLRQTRENLERAEDLQTLKKETMERLRAEAETAKRWEALEEARRVAQAFLFWRQREDARESVKEMDRTIGDLARSADETKERLRKIESFTPEAEKVFEKTRGEALVAVETVRKGEREIVQLEAQRAEENRRRQEAAETLRAAEDALREKEAERVQLEVETARDVERERQLVEESQTLVSSADQARALVRSAEEALRNRKSEYDRAQSVVQENRSALETARAKLNALTGRLESLARHKALQREAERPEVPDEKEGEELREKYSLAKKDCEEARVARDRLQRRSGEVEGRLRNAQRAYEKAMSDEKTAAAKLDAARESLRRAERANDLGRWLDSRGFGTLSRVSTLFRVDPNWRVATEALLSDDLNARLLTRENDRKRLSEGRAPGCATFWRGYDGGTEPPETEDSGMSPCVVAGETFSALISFMEASEPAVRAALCEVLRGYYACPSLNTAIRLQDELPEGVTLVTPEGDRVTRRRIALWAKTTDGLLTLAENVRVAEKRYEEVRATFIDVRSARTEAERDDAAYREALRDALRLLREAEEAQRRGQWALERWTERKRDLQHRLEEAARREKLLLEEEAEVIRQKTTIEEGLATREERVRLAEVTLSDAKKRVETATNALEYARNEQKALDYRTKLLSLEAGECRKALAAARVRAERVATDTAREKGRVQKARAVLEADLVVTEERLKTVRSRQAEILRRAQEAKLREDESLRTVTRLREEERSLREALAPILEAIGRKKTDRQAKFVLYEQFTERFRETGFDEDVLAERARTDDARVPVLRQRVQKLASDIQRLGEVNHAALAGLRRAEEEYEHAKNNMQDLVEAAKTLETAIRKIDAETRTRLRVTFRAVSEAFEETFKELFGGGEAKLVMTGDDVLEAGIEVMARPPGKKNASLDLLSGGEKSLTATALVFAFFRQNPAPFCLLDEVDAPLDEANQARYAALCRRLSEKTQFLLITHNRVTMEYADVLIGVTMKEPGVSRVVSVDVEEASKWGLADQTTIQR